MARLAGKPTYIVLAILATAWIILLRIMLPFEAIPFVFEEFLAKIPVSLWSPLKTALPLFGIGLCINFIKMVTTTNPPEVRANAPMIPIAGFRTSLIAGLFEEITFRRIIFYAFIGLFWFAHQALIAITGYGDVEWFSNQYLGWFTDLIIGPATGVLDHPGAWTVGLAVLASNWKFQEGHVYQGLLGFLLSGFGGLVFFRIMLGDGLLAAIITHFLFDLMIFLMLYVDVSLEELAGNRQAKSKFYRWYATRPTQSKPS